MDYSDVQVISAIITRQVPSFPLRPSFGIREREEDTLTNVCQASWNHDPESRPDMEFFLGLLQDYQEHEGEEYHTPSITPTAASREKDIVQVDELVQLEESHFRIPTDVPASAKQTKPTLADYIPSDFYDTLKINSAKIKGKHAGSTSPKFNEPSTPSVLTPNSRITIQLPTELPRLNVIVLGRMYSTLS